MYYLDEGLDEDDESLDEELSDAEDDANAAIEDAQWLLPSAWFGDLQVACV